MSRAALGNDGDGGGREKAWASGGRERKALRHYARTARYEPAPYSTAQGRGKQYNATAGGQAARPTDLGGEAGCNLRSSRHARGGAL